MPWTNCTAGNALRSRSGRNRGRACSRRWRYTTTPRCTPRQGVGDPTEVALFAAAATRAYDNGALGKACPRLAEMPFDSDAQADDDLPSRRRPGDRPSPRVRRRRWSSAAHRALDRREQLAIDRHSLADAERMAADGLRVLAVAWRVWDEMPARRHCRAVETGTHVPRARRADGSAAAGGKEAVALCRSAGIGPVMITGDHPGDRARHRQAARHPRWGRRRVMTGRGAAISCRRRGVRAARSSKIRVYARVATRSRRSASSRRCRPRRDRRHDRRRRQRCARR